MLTLTREDTAIREMATGHWPNAARVANWKSESNDFGTLRDYLHYGPNTLANCLRQHINEALSHEASCQIHDFLVSLTREQLIRVCVWNDRNGCFTDEDSIREFGEPATDDQLREVLQGWLSEEPAEEVAEAIKRFEAHK